MSDEKQGGAPKKMSTKDILAAARAQSGKPAEAAPAAPEPEATPPAPAAPAAPAAGAAKPKSTADILAAARAQKAAGASPAGEAPAAAEAPAAPAAKPKSTADILAAARAQKTAGGAAPAAPAAGAKPKSTADILAAARAQKTAGAAPAAAEAPAAATSPKAAPAAAIDESAPKLSVQEMLAAVRPGGVEAAAPKPAAKPVAPPMPEKPLPSSAKTKKGAAADESRRNVLVALLLSPFALAWTFLTATSAIAGLAVARFMMPNVLTEPPRKFKIGPPTDYDLGTVATKLVAQYGVWIVHTDQYQGKNLIYALASVCTHLGCTPSWLEGEQKFKCPCHGSGFYITGVNFEGPAPRPLERVGIRISEDGMLEVDKSLKFQEEMGQWADPASFFEVVG
jgi:cytochrome b6-f complex iron-sulfur subunit